ncbi:MAG: hypothetical protein O3C10_08100 [Chloroflexi bacterium]|nr:hypothetical protein [Chloroflexota bacterium]
MFKRLAAPGIAALGLLAVVLLATIGGGSADASANNGARGLERAIAAQEGHTDALLTKAGVVGTAIGLGDDGEAVILILTDQRGVTGLPSQLDGVAAVAHFTGSIVAHKNPCSGPLAQRPPECSGGDDPAPEPAPEPTPGPLHPSAPVGIGSSTGSERLIVSGGSLFCTVGTLAGPVNDGVNTFALSNAHVYALEGSKSSGTVQTGSGGDRMLYPGRVDMLSAGCGTPAEIDAAEMARLSDFQAIKFRGRNTNTIDAAIALAPAGNLTMALADGSGTVSTTTQAATLGLPVKKLGRTTLATAGNVTGINVMIRVGYDDGIATFSNQIMVGGGNFSSGGDSGSLIMTQVGNHPVALLFAGGDTATFGNPIDEVLNHFGVGFGVAP